MIWKVQPFEVLAAHIVTFIAHCKLQYSIPIFGIPGDAIMWNVMQILTAMNQKFKCIYYFVVCFAALPLGRYSKLWQDNVCYVMCYVQVLCWNQNQGPFICPSRAAGHTPPPVSEPCALFVLYTYFIYTLSIPSLLILFSREISLTKHFSLSLWYFLSDCPERPTSQNRPVNTMATAWTAHWERLTRTDPFPLLLLLWNVKKSSQGVLLVYERPFLT